MKNQVFKRVVIAFFVLAIGSFASISANSQDLFKKDKGGLSDAFGKKDNKKSSTSLSGYGFSEMEKFVLTNKFKDTKKLTERAYRFTYEHEEWTLPTILEISKSNTNIWVTMILKHPKIDPLKYPDRLMKMLEWNGSLGDSFFSIIPSSKAITIVAALQLNGPVDDSDVKDKLEYLGGLAVQTQDLWDTSKWADAPRHVGTWQGEGGNKMSVVLDRNGKFELTSSSGSITKGSYSLGGGEIEMTEMTDEGAEGEKIKGKIEFSDANHFTLTVGENKLKFVRK